jgi:23S rRNA pseudouridine2457 synthase
MLIVFNKPCGVLSQFTGEAAGQRTLAEFYFPPDIYPLGRLDSDSEGLLLLGDEPTLVERLLNPRQGHWRAYHVQVEGVPTDEALRQLAEGIVVQGRKTLAARASSLAIEPVFPLRDPPIRFRRNIPTSWLEVELHEGRNRQVRRMTAAVGLPTLRLVRVRIGKFAMPDDLPFGGWREVTADERNLIFL